MTGQPDSGHLAGAFTGPPVSDDDLLIRCDSLLSLIRHREASGLSGQTVRDLDELLRPLRARTDEIIRGRREGGST